MAKNYVHDGVRVTVAAPYALTSGGGCKVGALFGVAQTDAESGAPVALVTQGVFDLVAEDAGSGQDLAVGDVVYWDDTNRRATKTATDNMRIGVAVAAKASTATTVRVRLTDDR
ncbi:hypothetical protein GCM10010964_43570 [Caldovatus sediminis]|uniref:DUF2190 family protein n=1 Tax=Caldovatus sediminis TaxID=2041189 RepID=A0A8J3EF76_9PROT|nr:DUF2190 family protein [Caldovatus sediminis]GGG51669.1 hypothetical protein GCM10010964_43570 [Caldovatus sediminis]